MAENDSLQNELSCVEEFPKSAQISIVMPFYNAAHYLERSLPPLLEMCARGDILEVIAVDDGSTDSSTPTAAGLGANAVSSDGGAGPGGARNYMTHNRVETMTLIDRTIPLDPDNMEHVDAPLEHHHHPLSLFAAGFIGLLRLTDVEGRGLECCD